MQADEKGAISITQKLVFMSNWFHSHTGLSLLEIVYIRGLVRISLDRDMHLCIHVYIPLISVSTDIPYTQYYTQYTQYTIHLVSKDMRGCTSNCTET